ncbi:MAG TPA: hypothetical protein PLF70_01080 [Candidatus Portnoybacteria bacterium]|nr:hypothetical protein [Candidatus Portnoybacteria bacterium]
MNTTLKKTLIIIIVVLIVALIGLLVYNFLLKPKTISTNNNSNQNKELPGGGTVGNNAGVEETNNNNNETIYQQKSRIKAISTEPVLSPTISSDKSNIIYFLNSAGNIFESDFTGSTATAISKTVLENLKNIIWAPNKNKAIMVFQDNMENVSKYLYNLSDEKSLPLGKYLNYISWSADSNKIAYQYQNETTGANDISIASPDGSKFSVVLSTRMKNLIVEWPSINIYLRERPSGLAQSNLYSLSPTSKALNKTIANVYGFSVKWSQKGDKLLYSSTSPKGENIGIFITDNNGGNKKAIGVSTLAEKCVWSQDVRYIFCAIPKNIAEAKVLPDDFYKEKFIGDDEFYKIDVGTGEKINILGDENLIVSYDAKELFLSPQEDYLFFVNKRDGRLYSIEL